MKTFIINGYKIQANDAVQAVKLYKLVDADNNVAEIDYLTEEEKQAVEDYREAIKKTTNPKLLEVYAHILKEETEHIKELQEAKNLEDTDCDKTMNDDRLSPMTYKKLKELGVSSEQWSKWTQEEANRFIASKTKNTTSNKNTKENIEETTKQTSYEASSRYDLPRSTDNKYDEIADKVYDILHELNTDYDGDIDSGFEHITKFDDVVSALNKAKIDYYILRPSETRTHTKGLLFFN